MDTGKGSRKRESEEEIDLTNESDMERLRKEFVDKPPDMDFEMARKHNQQVCDSIRQSLDKGIKSRWVTRREKEQLKLFRFIIAEQGKMAEVLLNHTEGFYGLKEMLFNIFLEIERTKGLTEKNIGSIKSRMEKILESPAVKQVEKIIADNQEALNKLDKIRQQVLRDSLV